MTVSNVNVSAATLGTYIYTATGGETSKSGPDDNGATLSYTPGKELVHVNGVLLVKTSDYTATDGSSITLVNALVAGDVLEVISFSPFSVANAIPSTVVTAKGDLIAASSSGTVTNLPVGADGTTLVANSASATGVAWAGPTFTAGKNKIINGDFGVWQRGTSFSSPASSAYNADRFYFSFDGTGATRTISQQPFTPGTAPVTGYESAYFWRLSETVAGTGGTYKLIGQKIEDVRTYAGQTVTISFWGKADASRSVSVALTQNFGSGGSAAVTVYPTGSNLTTSWARYTYTTTLASIAGKTIGTNSYLEININFPLNTTQTVDIWGVQVEAGSVATPFTTATGTFSGELAACQRYLPVYSGGALSGYAYGTNTTLYAFKFPVTARVAPTSITVVNNPNMYALNTSTTTAASLDLATVDGADLLGSITITAGQGSRMMGGNILFNGCEL